MTLSIRWKVTAGALATLAVGLTVAALIAIRSVEQHELARALEALDARSALVAPALAPLLDGSPASLQAAVRGLSRQAHARITVIRRDGTVAADSETPDQILARLENHGSRPEVMRAWQSGYGTDHRRSQTTGQRLFYFARLLDGRDGRDQVVLRLALPLTVLDHRSRELQKAVAIAFGIAFLVSVGISIFIARGLTRPLSEMAVVARRLADGALGQRVRAGSRDEIGILAGTLNAMADQLEVKIRQVTEDRAQLWAILSSMVEGIMVLDGAGRVLQVNPAWEHIFSARSEEIKGRLHPEVIRHPEITSIVSQALETRRAQSGEVFLTAGRRVLRVEASPVSGGAGPNQASLVLVFYDVTALRRLEQVRKDFVANVSHELRTPLTSIKGYVEALLDGGKDDPHAAEQFLQIIRKQSDRLNLLLDDLLQLSQIESGQIEISRHRVRLETITERTIGLIKALADKKGHMVTAAFPPDLPAVLGDEERLVQVLTNLLDNAVKYTPPNGQIAVTARHLPPPQPAGPSQGMVELTVADTGIGIPEADRPRVFERFYRVDKARSRELGGTGLGLTIVRHIVEGHGGKVWVEGNRPTGSRFLVTLPVYGEPDAATHRADHLNKDVNP
jgi:two-component system phosphate regulon sensor histidine kinase PhoR